MPASASRDRSIVRLPAFAVRAAVVPVSAAVVMMPTPRMGCVRSCHSNHARACTVNQPAVPIRWYEGQLLVKKELRLACRGARDSREALIDLHARQADRLGPLLRFGRHEVGELLRRAAKPVGAESQQRPANLRGLRRTHAGGLWP